MRYTVFMIGEKVNFRGCKTLDDAHAFCIDDGSPINLIFEHMSPDDIFYNRLAEPLAMYVNGKRYDVSENTDEQEAN